MPRVSVIVPNYNHALFLRERLDTILQQSFTDFELIVLDDCSTDNSAEILREYQGRFGFKLVINERNSGSPFAQWNKGVSQAKGEYLWIAESDDSCDKEFLQTLVPLLDHNPGVGLAFCCSWMIGAQGERLYLTPGSNMNYDESGFSRDFLQNGREFCAEHLAFRSTIPNASAVLVRKSAFLAAGGADTSMQLGGDWFTWIRILESWQVAYTAKPLNFYRRAHEQTQRRAALKHKAPIAELGKVIHFVEERFPVSAKTSRAAKYYIAHLWLEFEVQALFHCKFRPFNKALREGLEFDSWIFLRALAVLIRQSALCLKRLLYGWIK